MNPYRAAVTVGMLVTIATLLFAEGGPTRIHEWVVGKITK